MSVIALVSAKGSPGVTTTAQALAAVWPEAAVVADLDPAGGDLAWRASLADGSPLDPGRGLLSLGAAVRRGAAEATLSDHLQDTGSGDVLVGVRAPEQLAGLGGAWSQFPAVLRAHADDVLADCGRLVQGSPAMTVVQGADAVCFVVRPHLDGTAHLRERLNAFRDVLDIGRAGGTPVGVALVTSYKNTSVAQEMQQLLDHEEIGARVLGIVADDPKSAAGLASRRRMPRTSMLVRSAVSLGEALRDLVRSRHDVGAGR